MHVHSTHVFGSSSVPDRSIPPEALAEALARHDTPTVIDVRDADEFSAAAIEGSLHLPLPRLLASEGLDVEKANKIILMCASGKRAEAARAHLVSRGYTDVRVAAGGMSAWLARGYPATGTAVPTADVSLRYDRQMRLPEVGATGQAKLLAARVAVVGVGGLGCPSLLYLAAAGVGHLTLVDHDEVAPHNLHRQVLYGTADVGRKKVLAAKDALLRRSPDLHVETHTERLTDTNAEGLLAGHDVLVDATDNYAARSALNRASCMLLIPAIIGAVSRFDGEVLTVVPGSACYACLHPAPPGQGLERTCAEEGVLGVVPGLVGLLQANEVLKLVLGYGSPLVGRLLVMDARATSFRSLALDRDPSCRVCGAR